MSDTNLLYCKCMIRVVRSAGSHSESLDFVEESFEILCYGQKFLLLNFRQRLRFLSCAQQLIFLRYAILYGLYSRLYCSKYSFFLGILMQSFLWGYTSCALKCPAVVPFCILFPNYQVDIYCFSISEPMTMLYSSGLL